MQQPGEDYQQAEPEQKRISLWLIGSLGAISILVFLAIAALVVFPLPLPSSTSDNATRGEEEVPSETSASIPSEVEEEVRGIVEGDVSEAIEISNIEDDGHIYRIDIELLSEPESYDPVQRWTKIVCQRCSGIFKNHGIDRDISVWAKHSENVYGRTYCSQGTDEVEFTKAEDLE